MFGLKQTNRPFQVTLCAQEVKINMRTLSGLKEYIYYLEGLGELRKISNPVDRQYEIPAILNQLGGNNAPAILFERVKGYTVPVVGNLLGTPRRLALALGTSEEDVLEGKGLDMKKKISPFFLNEENERIILSLNEESNILEFLPVLTHYKKDSGPFITTGITSAKDPRNGNVGRGLHRIEIRGKTNLGISLVNPPLSDIYAFHKRQGTRMKVAVTVGVDPAIFIGSILKAPKGVDKLSATGGMVGSAIATVKAQTDDIEIPAYAEIVLEGYIDPKEDESVSNLGEVSGIYVGFSSPTVHVTTVSMRRNAVYHGLLPWGAEVDLMLAFIFGRNIIPRMKSDFPSLIDIHFMPQTFGSHVVMSMESDDRGDIRRALTAMLSFANVKKAVIVNEDVNIRKPLEVEWAMATRFQADQDMIVFSGLKGAAIDPSAGDKFQTTKLGIDATRPSRKGFGRIQFPDEIQSQLPYSLDELNIQEKL